MSKLQIFVILQLLRELQSPHERARRQLYLIHNYLIFQREQFFISVVLISEPYGTGLAQADQEKTQDIEVWDE
jgi:hypothetical protein